MNLLYLEKSPYLQQHAQNPVHWQAWNNTSLQLAKKSDKLMIISIGYATCHWCHVMEHESFENEEVAALMNQHFVSIKVDREERPDVDDYYMDAIHLMGQQGGWPLNCVALPDGRPIWAATYVPKDKWMAVLQQLAEMFVQDRDRLEEYATQVNNGLKRMNLLPNEVPESEVVLADEVEWVHSLAEKFDFEWGGMQRAPKFPMPDVYRFLLRFYATTGQSEILDFVIMSLHRMSGGGMFDQIGGGFARYSVDAHWFVPHFEKMLYDNGQLLSLCAEAYVLSQDERLKEVIHLCIEFLQSELLDENGGFYCGLDADSEGSEGKYYTFTSNELQSKFGAVYEKLQQTFSILPAGNWEHGANILKRPVDKQQMPVAAGIDQWETLRKEWLNYRNQRIKPALDNKILCSWNALTIIGLIDTACYAQHSEAGKLAKKALVFIMEKLIEEQSQLYRVYHSGSASVPAFFEDYALLIAAAIRVFEYCQNREYLHLANDLTHNVIDKFGSKEGILFYNNDAENTQIAVRKVATSDNVIPSANAVMAENLFRLGHYYLQTEWIERSQKMLAYILHALSRDVEFYSYWARLHNLQSRRFYEVVVTGPQANSIINEINSWFLPGKVIVKAIENDELLLSQHKYSASENLIYLCEHGMCHQPFTSIEALQSAIWQ